MARFARSSETPMQLEYETPRLSFNNANQQYNEPPRKRTHYEAMDTMDWRSEPAPRPLQPINLFSKSNITSSNSPATATSGPHASTSQPFIFHTASMQIDEPSTVVSSSQDSMTAPSDLNEREIANGAVKRENKKRTQNKDWQLVPTGHILNEPVKEEHERGKQDEEDGSDEDVANASAFAFSAPLKHILKRKASSRRRGDFHQPVHLSLHNHNHHYSTSQEPFIFRAGQETANVNVGADSLYLSNPPRSAWWHEEGPYILLGYLQFAFNGALVCLALYLITTFVLLVSRDISERTHEYSIEVQQSIMHCSEQYIQNRCQPGQRVPILEQKCQEWEHCMNKNPKVALGKTRIGAEIFAEIINSFVEVVTWRTQIFIFTVLFILVKFTNSSISSYRQTHIASYSPRIQQAHSTQRRPELTTYKTAPPALSMGEDKFDGQSYKTNQATDEGTTKRRFW